jgi:hypothetical protein
MITKSVCALLVVLLVVGVKGIVPGYKLVNPVSSPTGFTGFLQRLSGSQGMKTLECMLQCWVLMRDVAYCCGCCVLLRNDVSIRRYFAGVIA